MQHVTNIKVLEFNFSKRSCLQQLNDVQLTSGIRKKRLHHDSDLDPAANGVIKCCKWQKAAASLQCIMLTGVHYCHK